MRTYLKYAGIWVFVLLLGGMHYLNDVEAISKEDVEIFVEGKRYKNLHDYKLDTLKKNFKDTLAAVEDDKSDQFFDNLLKELKSKYREEFTEDELTNLVNDLRKEYSQANTEIEEKDELTQMQEMLDKYLDRHNETDALNIDPRKVKTITIRTLEDSAQPASDAAVDEAQPSQ